MSSLIYPFWSKNDKRLRSLWRIILQITLWIILSIVMAFPLRMVFPDSAGEMSSLWRITLGTIGLFLSLTLSLYIMGRFVDRRLGLGDYGLRLNINWWKDFIFGLLLGLILMTGIFFVQLALGWITVNELYFVNNSLSFGIMICFIAIQYICVGFYEEMMSRGYHMRNIAEGMNFLNPQNAVILAWVLSSIVFGIAHGLNPNASIISTFNIILGGLLLGLHVLLTGRLGVAVGLHITWNFAQGSIFGFSVSGHASDVSFISIHQTGPDTWTGGVFGPEAGLLGLIAMLIGCAFIVIWTHWQDEKLQIQTEFSNNPVVDKA